VIQIRVISHLISFQEVFDIAQTALKPREWVFFPFWGLTLPRNL
jgi:hypothetical protein